MFLLYNAAIRLFRVLIWLSSFTQTKTRQWILGRKHLLQQLEAIDFYKHPIVWFHCASLGEFEQGRPVIEQFRADFPQYKILLTFFSPSGYEVRKNYQGADFVFYLPLDTPSNARRFVEIVRPKLVFFIKYEFWFNYLKYLRANNIPLFYVSVIFRPQQVFFKWYGGWFRRQIQQASHFFLQNEASALLLQSIGIPQFSISGDTRFDRVHAIARSAPANPLIVAFTQHHRIVLLGSSWEEDEQLIQSVFHDLPADIKLIIAPHEPSAKHVQQIHQLFSFPVINYSELNAENAAQHKAVCIDPIGMLSSLYQYAHIAFIGGGFGKGIHNVLEAATFGKPVVFGPNYQKFAEAVELIGTGGAFSVRNSSDLLPVLQQLFSEDEFYKKTSQAAKQYVESKTGACKIILEHTKEALQIQ
ncbi:MAG: glycosyltransferase N-terminal domain-containing protein [Bacteroidota bacterium]